MNIKEHIKNKQKFRILSIMCYNISCTYSDMCLGTDTDNELGCRHKSD